MERDQEKFYEEEEQNDHVDAQPVGDNEEVNDMVYFIEIIKNLRAVISQGKRLPMLNRAMVDTDQCLAMLDELDHNLPDAIQYGMRMYEEKSRIMSEAEETAIARVTTAERKAQKALEQARQDASQIVLDAEEDAKAIVADAQERADHMVSEDEIVRQARDEARSIKNDARVEAGEMRLKAAHDVYQMISQVEGSLNETMREIKRLKAEATTEHEN